MARVCFTPNLQRHVAAPEAVAPGATVREVLDGVFAANPRLRGYLVDEQGALRKHVSIFVNNLPIADRARLSDPVAPDAEIFVMQALSGGERLVGSRVRQERGKPSKARLLGEGGYRYLP